METYSLTDDDARFLARRLGSHWRLLSEKEIAGYLASAVGEVAFGIGPPPPPTPKRKMTRADREFKKAFEKRYYPRYWLLGDD